MLWSDLEFGGGLSATSTGSIDMSIHCINTRTRNGVTVVVQAGWDEALGGFALLVYPEGASSGDAEPSCYYSNLDLMPGVPLGKGCVEMYANLTRLGIDLPSSMRSAILRDRSVGMANKRVLWDSKGAICDVRTW
jgi:hypothetical protein